MTRSAAPFTTLITAAECAALGDAACVVDCSHDLGDPTRGRREFVQGHLPGAVHLQLDQDLSGPCDGRNGRHPLPDPEQLANTLAGIGLRRGQQVVVVDRSQGTFASRLWWMLRWLGHPAVAVLDGGWQAWLAAGGAIETGPASPRAPGDFRRAAALVGCVDTEAVLANLGSRRLQLIDARSPQRYRGEGETLDPIGGHIPGARCRFYQDNLAADGCFKPPQQLRTEWLQLLGARDPAQIVNQCGSGVSACHNLLALEIAGLPGALLYPGSWSAWCADPQRPVARGSEPG